LSPSKTVEQLDLQALHRMRERLVWQRTSVINQIRAFLLERGIAVRQGLRALRTEMPIILGMTDKLSPRIIHGEAVATIGIDIGKNTFHLTSARPLFTPVCVHARR
jgi:transposase